MILDIVFVILLLLAFIHGYRKGLIHSIVSLLALIVGIMAAVYLSELVSVYLDKWFNIGSKYLPLISFIAVFIAIYFLFRMLEKLLEGFFKLLKLNFINQFAGAIIWSVIWILLFSTILFYSNNIGLLSEELKKESIVYEKAAPFAPKTIELIGQVIPPVKNIFNSLQEWFQHLEESDSTGNTKTAA